VWVVVAGMRMHTIKYLYYLVGHRYGISDFRDFRILEFWTGFWGFYNVPGVELQTAYELIHL
jgi:hypothetical protein